MTDAHLEELTALIREYGTAVLCEGKVDLPRQINRIVSHFRCASAPADSRPKVILPPRVIDQLCQQAGVSTYHPDGDQQKQLHVYVAGVVEEVLARLQEGVAPESQVITLPPRAIDQIFQRAGVSTSHPDGDLLEKLHVLANLTMAETLARLPSDPAHAGHADAGGQSLPGPVSSGCLSLADSQLLRTRDREEVGRAIIDPASRSAAKPSLMPRDRVREIFMAHGFTIKDGETDLKAYVFDAADALLAAADVVRSPEFLAKEAAQLSPHSRAMLLNILWRHQGGSSPVGQIIRAMLGVGRHDHLTEEQVSMAKWIGGVLDQAESGEPVASVRFPIKDHQIARVVNDLRDIAVECRDTQQLRERIAERIVPILKASPSCGAARPSSVGGAGTPWRVGVFYSSSTPGHQVRMLIEGEKDIAYAAGRSDFVAWICSGFGDSPAQALSLHEKAYRDMLDTLVDVWKDGQQSPDARSYAEGTWAEVVQEATRMVSLGYVANVRSIRLTRERATAAIDDFEIIGENESSRDPTPEERYAIESYLDRLFVGCSPAASPIPA
ncbi:hypothetical protein A9R05_42350 (plasmid) [Burkholderia sp. KK1]|uniref:Uncharacterized protein n=1 Tax=Burkholderia sp. M701 TaxID=326454 RepID=V5YND2_9BURK|nr:hypothetical protein [Burkholderia sp. M701]AQH05662.1 hypothetical protein A9R05_42350 [Burkholderia sp. KK1]BAO18912.1 hypothetical protein [Burkholderia sp. M701]